MARVSHSPPVGMISPSEQIRHAREILARESEALELVSARLDTEFCRAADLLFQCAGNVLVSGIGKAGIIAQKLTATLASTGTPAHYLHPAEAIHGDLGRVTSRDVVWMLSQSGETEEITRLLPPLAERSVPVVAMTSRRGSTLGKAAAITLELGTLREACHLGLAPSTSTTAMLALGDALALVVSRMRGFAREDFYRFHPGGALGRKLAKVDEAMRPLAECRITNCSRTVRQVLAAGSLPRRRSGAIMVVDPSGVLRGIFTDSDLARLFESRQDHLLDQTIRHCMTKRPAAVVSGTLLSAALDILATRKISELPVVDEAGRPIGIIDVTDVLGLFPDTTRGTLVERRESLSADVVQSVIATAPLPISLDGEATVAAAWLGSETWIASGSAVPRPKSTAFFDPSSRPLRSES